MSKGREITNRRNHFGVKNSCDLYRNIEGELWVQWTSEWVTERAFEYRKNGIGARVIKGELFIRESDREKATQLDAKTPKWN